MGKSRHGKHDGNRAAAAVISDVDVDGQGVGTAGRTTDQGSSANELPDGAAGAEGTGAGGSVAAAQPDIAAGAGSAPAGEREGDVTDAEGEAKEAPQAVSSEAPGAADNSVPAGLPADAAVLDGAADSSEAPGQNEVFDAGGSGGAAQVQKTETEAQAIIGDQEDPDTDGEGSRETGADDDIDAAARASLVAVTGVHWGLEDDALAVYHVIAGFVRANPDAPVAAIPIHLRRSKLKYGEGVEPSRLDLAALEIFRDTLRTLDRARGEERAAANPPAPLPGGGMGTVGLRPSPGPFEATGFSAIDD